MATAQTRLLQWLRDAHAMEEQAETMLSGTASRIENYPALKAGLERHLEETRTQAKRLEECIERLGGSTSGIKTAFGKVIGFAQAASGRFVGDEVVKAMLATYAFEHMEIASYRILVAAAESQDEPEIKAVCEDILREEEAMAAWVADHISEITQQYLTREELPDVAAKH